jgi:Mrp family chromosome partitioning ATPase
LIFGKNKKRVKEDDRSKLLISFPANSRYAESYRTMRTNLFFADMDNEIRSILVTSALEKEGKTSTVANLGYTIAQTERRVLVMDCDLRRPYLSTLLTETKGRGVSDLITDVFGAHLTRGGLADYGVGDLLLLARLQKRSARLDLEDDTTRTVIFFENGEIASVLRQSPAVTETPAGRPAAVKPGDAAREICAMTSGTFVFSPPALESGEGAVSGLKIDPETLREAARTTQTAHRYCHAAIESAVLPTETENLFVLPSGKVPPNPAEMAGSRRMAYLVGYLKTRFDFIIIDTPPVTPASDALIMAPLVDGTLFVVKSGHTDRKIIQNAVDQFAAVKQPIIGAVISQVDMKKEGYYRYYNKYYSSYHGQ